jgi:hypothetical protein
VLVVLNGVPSALDHCWQAVQSASLIVRAADASARLDGHDRSDGPRATRFVVAGTCDGGVEDNPEAAAMAGLAGGTASRSPHLGISWGALHGQLARNGERRISDRGERGVFMSSECDPGHGTFFHPPELPTGKCDSASWLLDT